MNTTGTKNRIRFESISKRLRNVNIDIIHRVKDQKFVQSTPYSGEQGCHFQDELEHWRALDISASFRRFHFQIYPLVQSLPELIHHQTQIITILIEQLRDTAPSDCICYLALITTLGRSVFCFYPL